ncbi:MAG: hypothetical protein JWO98_4104 [Frankiales bacterium]|nr:hypothetical protein [Frankiales bacterium]
MHVTREEFFAELAKFTTWVNSTNADTRARVRRLEKWMENRMAILDADLGTLQGLLGDAESELIGQKARIDALGQQLADSNSAQAQADHAELLDSHDRLTSMLQGLRDAVETAQAGDPAAGGAQPNAGDGSGAPVVDPTPAPVVDTPAPVADVPAADAPAPAVADTPVVDAPADAAPAADAAPTEAPAPVDGSAQS